jgi:hypothetical protein
VFDEYTPQQEVYRESVSKVPKKLLDGISCTVLAYGQTGTGKTHTMLGEGLGVEMNVRANRMAMDQPKPQNEDELDPKKNPDVTEGMIPRVIADIFRLLQDAPDSIEYIVRCSFVEIYLEKLSDLLQPWREGIQIGSDDNGDACIVGASELCCLDPADLYALLARGNAYRTKAATDENTDSSRSHAVFTIRIEKIDRSTGKQVSSRLQMLDLAGSELGKQKSTRGKESATGLEARMINASLASVQNVIRGTLSQQGKEGARFNPRAYAHASKLAQLVRPCFGGKWFTTIICTGSPSSYNINETIYTVKFGQQARQVTNQPTPQEALTSSAYRARMSESERRQESMTLLVKMLADECKHVRGRSKGKDSGNAPLWEAIAKITAAGGPADGIELDVSVKGSKEDNDNDKAKDDSARIAELEKMVEEHKAAREKAESAVRDVKSDLTSLRSQKETLAKEKLRMEQELGDAKVEIKALSTHKTELDHHIRTSQFRENEAILFLRQFRTFYLRLLKNKAAHGSGSTRNLTGEVSKRIPGVSDLADLLDVDKLMVASGIIEDSEVGTDTNSPDYFPSQVALTQSAEAAEKAEEKETELIKAMEGMEVKSRPGTRVSIINTKQANQFTFGQLTSYRHKLLETPAGRLAIKKETELENDLTDLVKKCVSLQNSVHAEKAMVEALSARQGAMSKMKGAQELNTLRQELERKTNDLHAIVWKMNELHLVNKTIDTKVENREQHVNYLEEHLVDLQTRNRRLVIDRQEGEKRLREDNSSLKNQLDGMAAKIWQLGEPLSIPPWRLVLPYSGENVDLSMPEDQKRRLSLGNLEDEEIDGLISVNETKG